MVKMSIYIFKGIALTTNLTLDITQILFDKIAIVLFLGIIKLELKKKIDNERLF